MKKFAPLVVAIVALAVMVTPTAFAAGKAENCAVLDSGRITPPAGTASVTVTAPDGFLISDYCVKSGNVKSGGGAVNVNNADAETVTFVYPGGKKIGHYSYSLVEAPVVNPASCNWTTLTYPGYEDFTIKAWATGLSTTEVSRLTAYKDGVSIHTHAELMAGRDGNVDGTDGLFWDNPEPGVYVATWTVESTGAVQATCTITVS